MLKYSWLVRNMMKNRYRTVEGGSYKKIKVEMLRNLQVILCDRISIIFNWALMGCQTSNEHSHECCPPGSWPALQIQYTPKGKTSTLNGLKLYESGSGKKALVLFQDIFGIDSGKHFGIADTYADLGYRVYVPQLLDPVYKGPEDIPQILKVVQQQKIATIKQKYEVLIHHIKSQGSQTILAAGYCWGAWAAFRMSADYNNIRAIAAVHPSLNVQNFYGGKQTQLVQSVKCPAYFYSCSNDQPGTKKGGEYVKLLSDRFGSDKVGSQQFPQQKHGFIMRSDDSSQSHRRDTQKIIKMTLEYFSKFQ